MVLAMIIMNVGIIRCIVGVINGDVVNGAIIDNVIIPINHIILIKNTRYGPTHGVTDWSDATSSALNNTTKAAPHKEPSSSKPSATSAAA